ncbi:uncharacterized protein LOC122054077 [Zingiber officinale]|uniref:Uncharacterized protein n=1 Tax=Zingiber officinale TaxID=94328 RepID=A0A8J5HXL8_ZINOF|nr:uncharacterized protein LOC122054077 [Zingiber officinale]KAG6522066.1 hypothetical protein ZIOFF_019200 [Zingiber officinale]
MEVARPLLICKRNHRRRRRQRTSPTFSLAGGREREEEAADPTPIFGDLSPMGLLKMRSWSPDSDREEAWLRRQAIHRSRRGRLRSVTDEDLDELRGCIDLGFGFDCVSAADPAPARKLSETLPALDLYYAVLRGSSSAAASPASAYTESSSASPDVDGSVPVPFSLFSPGETAEERKGRLKQWAQVVACTVRQRR